MFLEYKRRKEAALPVKPEEKCHFLTSLLGKEKNGQRNDMHAI
jgi:hypothetical protein